MQEYECKNISRANYFNGVMSFYIQPYTVPVFPDLDAFLKPFWWSKWDIQWFFSTVVQNISSKIAEGKIFALWISGNLENLEEVEMKLTV